MSVKVYNIDDGVKGRFIKNDRFKTTFISFHFYLPLEASHLAADALLPYILTSCSNEYKSFTELNIKLLDLYGAELVCSVSKSGDFLHTRIGINVINEEFSLNNEKTVSEASRLLLSLIFDPSIDNQNFLEKDVEREKRKTIERIEGEINNKRSYVRSRLLNVMFPDEPYGQLVYGKKTDVERLCGQDILTSWKRLLSQSFIQVNAVGAVCPDELFSSFKNLIKGVNRKGFKPLSESIPLSQIDTVNDITERLDITQGKIALGFSSNLYGDLEKALPLLIFADVFGGGPYSKLFSNVREKKSLCYYCSASQYRAKGFVMVDSGIEPQNQDSLIKAVLSELEDLKQGIVEDDTIEASKMSITDSLASYYDSASALDMWYTLDIRGNNDITPKDIIERIRKVSKEDITRVAKGIELHSIYRLLPKNEVNC